MEEKKIKITVVIINCICAIVWNMNVVIDLLYGYSNETSFVLHIICAIMWNIFAFVWIMRYRKAKKQEKVVSFK